jgi:hypothetical protein
MRTVTKYWDLKSKTFRLITGARDTAPLEFYADEIFLLNVYLVANAEQSMALYDGFSNPVLETFQAVVDNDYNHNDDPIVPSADIAINAAGDWDGGTADPTEGEISIRIDGTSAILLAAIEGLAAMTASIELTAWAGDGSLAFVTRMPVTINNLMGR